MNWQSTLRYVIFDHGQILFNTTDFNQGQVLFRTMDLYISQALFKRNGQWRHAKQLCTKDMQMDFLVFSTSVYFRFSTVSFKSGCFVEYCAWIWGENWAPLNLRPMSWLTVCLKWVRSPGCKWLAEGLMAWHAVLVPQGVNAFTAGQRITVWLFLGCIFSRITWTYSTLLSVAQIVLLLSFSFNLPCNTSLNH